MRIAIGIPSFNRDDVLIDTIKQCLNQARRADEIIVVDQTIVHTKVVDLALNELRERRDIKYVLQASPSLPVARNTILRYCTCEIIIFIDDDVTLPVDFVERHLVNYVNDQSIDAIAGGVDQNFGWPAIQRPPFWPQYLDYRYFFVGGHERKHGIANFMGANHSLRVAKAIKAGGYDERFSGVALREESDLAIRLVASGGHVLFDPKARLIHLAVPTGGCRKANGLDISAARSNLLFAVKHITRIKRQCFTELWFSFRLGVINKASLKNPLTLFITLLKFLWLFVEIPFTLCTKRPNSF